MSSFSIASGPFKVSVDRHPAKLYVIRRKDDGGVTTSIENQHNHKVILVYDEATDCANDPLHWTMLDGAGNTSHINGYGVRRQEVSIFSIDMNQCDSKTERLWSLSRSSSSDISYSLEPVGPSELASTPRRKFIVLEETIISSEAIQQMNEIGLSSNVDIRPLGVSSNKLTFTNASEAELFRQSIYSLLADGGPTNDHQGAVPASQRRYSDKTGLVISIPRTAPDVSSLFPHKKRKYQEELSPKPVVASSSAQTELPGDSLLAPPSSSPSKFFGATDFFFLLGNDVGYLNLTDYLLLLFSQVVRGSMNETDLAKANRVKVSKYKLGFPGMICRHCEGKKNGRYFPTNVKNLSACTVTLYTHLLRCSEVPASVVGALKRTKSTHKYQAPLKNKDGSRQAVFFSLLWERIHSMSFTGVDDSTHILVDKLNHIVEESVVKSVAITNAVSYDEYTDCQPHAAVTDEDFEVALDLLRRPATPDNSARLCHEAAPLVNVTPTPINQVQMPVAMKIGSSGVVPGEQYETNEVSNQKKAKKSRQSDEDGKTRKFTRTDELLLIRGMLKHGCQSCWKKIYDEQPGLHHIKRSALKDRARSNRFKALLARVKIDPTLLDRPDQLCGSPDQDVYMLERSAPSHPPNDMQEMPLPGLESYDCQEYVNEQQAV